MRSSRWRLATTARLAVWLHAFWANARRRDLDNAAKCLDGANGIIWHDDSQIDELHVYRRVDVAHPRLEVIVEVLGG